jgi:hypothetical protein
VGVVRAALILNLGPRYRKAVNFQSSQLHTCIRVKNLRLPLNMRMGLYTLECSSGCCFREKSNQDYLLVQPVAESIYRPRFPGRLLYPGTYFKIPFLHHVLYIATEFPLKMLFCFYKAGNFVIRLAATLFQESFCSLKFMVGKFVNNLNRCHSMLENTVFIYSQLSY